MGDQDKGRSPKKLKSLMDVPNVAQLKVQVLSFNMTLISTPKQIPSPSCPFPSYISAVAILNVQVGSFNMIVISSP